MLRLSLRRQPLAAASCKPNTISGSGSAIRSFSQSQRVQLPRQRPRIFPASRSCVDQSTTSSQAPPPPPSPPLKPQPAPPPPRQEKQSAPREPAVLQSPSAYPSVIIRSSISSSSSSSSSSLSLTTHLTHHDRARLAFAAGFFQTDPRFLYSAAQLRDHPFNERVPELIVLGASNVGKSTFLNALTDRAGIARTSSRPGHTTLMNAFGVGPRSINSSSPSSPSSSSSSSSSSAKNRGKQASSSPGAAARNNHGLVLMDTPGYGYKSQKSWGDTIVRYLQSRRKLRGAVVLLSAEKNLMPGDTWVLQALADANVRTMVVLTKADKAVAKARKAGSGTGSETEWAAICTERAVAIREALQCAQKATISRAWKEGDGWFSDIYVTAAGLHRGGKGGNNAGIDGVRAAMLEMAGFQVKRNAIQQQPKNVAYTGDVVSFDDIVWKS